MRKSLSKVMLCVVIVLSVAIGFGPTRDVKALESDPYIQKNNTIVVNYPGKNSWDNKYWFNVKSKQIPKSIKNLSVKTSNKKCVSVEKPDGRLIVLSAKKKGKATITITGKKGKKKYQYKAKIKVIGWSNPASKVVVKNKNYASQFTKRNYRYCKVKTDDRSIKVSAKGKKGYKVKSLIYRCQYNVEDSQSEQRVYVKDKKIKNNKTFQRANEKNLKSEEILITYESTKYKNLWDHMSGPTKKIGPGITVNLGVANKEQ